jgi:hypothetical protein
VGARGQKLAHSFSHMRENTVGCTTLQEGVIFAHYSHVLGRGYSDKLVRKGRTCWRVLSTESPLCE